MLALQPINERPMLVSSSVLNAVNFPGLRSESTRRLGSANVLHGDSKSKAFRHSSEDVIPDSEEERLREERAKPFQNTQVIEISSDEENGSEDIQNLEDNFLKKIPGAWPGVESSQRSSGPQSDIQPSVILPAIDRHCGDTLPSRNLPQISKKIQILRSRRIIQSSSSEASDSETRNPRGENELSNSSPGRSIHGIAISKSKLTPKTIQRKPVPPSPQTSLPLYIDEDEPQSDDNDAVLTFDEPKTARKPIQFPTLNDGGPSMNRDSPGPRTPRKQRPGMTFTVSKSDDGGTVADPIDPGTPSRAQPCPPSSKPKKSRQTQAARVLAEQARREAYAQNLFSELNRDVFDNGLPKETKLNWNKRLLTTAGRAKWHRSRDGVETTEVELAMKILDCDERIRNTLSHEMCHLASWIIDGDPKEAHGNIWKRWATKVMRKRPDIEVTTKHHYDISYPYEWKCQQCSKIYGRFSKSIRPAECVCGACKVGKLIPLFNMPQRGAQTPKTTADSRMAAGKSQDSPCSINHRSSPSTNGTGVIGTRTHLSTNAVVYFIDDSDLDSDSDLEILTTALGGQLSIAD